MSKFDELPAGLREIADENKLAEALQPHLGPALSARAQRIGSCHIDQLRCKPGGGCRLLFTIAISQRDNESVGDQTFFGRLIRKNVSHVVTEALNRANLTMPRFGPPVFFIPEWSLLVWAYPNDPELPGLSVLNDGEKILWQAKSTPEKFGLSSPPLSASGETTKYVPGMRCGMIYRIARQMEQTSGMDSAHSVYGKAYRAGEGAQAFAIMKRVWESDACQRGDFAIPRPYSFDAEYDILWQEALPGKPLADTAAQREDLPALSRKIGKRLAAFHGIQLNLPVEKELNFQIEEIKAAMTAMRKVFPQVADRCDVVGRQLLEAAEKLEKGSATPVHVSFKFSHIFDTAQGIVFIDFDGARLGDPGYDVGRFIAHLYKMKADWKIDPAIAEKSAANFCEAYNLAAAVPLSQAKIDWFKVSHLLCSQLYKTIKRRDASLMNKLLKMTERLCSA
jgi:thiamine kinase-like enzyme